MRILTVDPHAIYRRGLVASLEMLACVERVDEAADAVSAARHPAFAHADVVIVAGSTPGACELVRAVAAGGGRAIVCSESEDCDAPRAMIEAGAVGYLRKDTLTPEMLQAALDAARAGAVAISTGALTQVQRQPAPVAAGRVTGGLSEREQRVLALVAGGYPTREVAIELNYSERTVKNVLHDVAMKLNARCRAHVIACAVREGLI